MTIGSVFGDIMVSLKKKSTDVGPLEFRVRVPAYLNGMITWDYKTCTGCMYCQEDCPSNAIKMIKVEGKENRLVMQYDLSKCIFCGQCSISCEPGSITTTTNPFEPSSMDKQKFQLFYGDIEDVVAVRKQQLQK